MDEKELVGFIEQRRYDANEVRKVYEKDWYVNIAYTYGKQWLRYATVSNRLFAPEARDGSPKFSSNLILPAVRIITSKILKTKPVLIVVPPTRDQRDVEKARVDEKVLQHLHRKLHLDLVYQEVTSGMIQTANYYLKPYWNKNAGDVISEPKLTTNDTGLPYLKKNKEEQDEQQKNSNGQLLYQEHKDGVPIEDSFAMGDIDIDIVTPFELQVDPTAKRIHEARYIIHEKVRSIEYIEDVYGKKVKPDDVSGPGVIEQQLLNILGQKDKASKVNKDSAVLSEYWEAPTKKYPKGRKIVKAGGEICSYEEEFPREYKTKFPIIKFGYIPVYGRFYDTTTIENARPLQKEYNKILSDILEFKNRTQFGKTLIPTSCKVGENSFTDEPAEKIYYNAIGGKPEIMSYPVMNMEANSMLLQIIKSDIYDIFGIHEVSHSKTPKGVRSGQAIAYLQEQDDTQLGPVISRFEESIEEFGNMMLNIAREKYKEPRLITLMGQEGKDDIDSFEVIGDDISEEREIICQMSSAFPQHRIAKQQMIMEYLKAGIVDPKEARRLLELGSEDIFKDDKRDEYLAQFENEEFMKGNFCVAQDYHNAPIHLKEHNKIRNVDTYAKVNPATKKAFDAHIATHEEMMKAKMQMMQSMQPEQGKPQGKPVAKGTGGIPNKDSVMGIK